MLKPSINLQTLPQHSATVLSFILVIACAQVLAQLTWMLVPSGNNTISGVAQRTSTPVKIQSRHNDIGKLAMAHLFGTVEKTAVDSKQVTTVTRLNLVLRGVFAASNPKYAIAIISSGKNGDEEVYGVGDPLPGNATLHAVHSEDVILERNGQLEILKLPKDTSSDLPGINPGGNSGYNPASYNGSPGAALAQIRNTILHHPTSFGDYALPMVVREHGKQIGYRLMPQAKGKELLHNLGIEPNDIITSINGVKMDDPRNGIAALRKLESAQAINITVKRNGVEVPLTIQLH